MVCVSSTLNVSGHSNCSAPEACFFSDIFVADGEELRCSASESSIWHSHKTLLGRHRICGYNADRVCPFCIREVDGCILNGGDSLSSGSHPVKSYLTVRLVPPGPVNKAPPTGRLPLPWNVAANISTEEPFTATTLHTAIVCDLAQEIKSKIGINAVRKGDIV